MTVAEGIRRRVGVCAVICITLVLSACNHGQWEGEGRLPNREAVFAAMAAGQPDSAFAKFEDGLLGLYPLALSFHITSEGAFTVDLRGRLDLSAAGDTLISATGTFGEEPVELVLVATGGRLIGGNYDARFDVEQSPSLDLALLIGMTRMGLLHNLALLVAGQPPDHAAGGVRSWVVPLDLATLRGEGAEGFRFGIQVSGVRSGAATLALDPETGLPTRREQTVEFPGGRMTVTERYAY